MSSASKPVVRLLSNQGQEIVKAALKRTLEDPDFKDALKENPAAALGSIAEERAVKLAIPDKFEFVVLEDSGTRQHLAIPSDGFLGGEAQNSEEYDR